MTILAPRSVVRVFDLHRQQQGPGLGTTDVSDAELAGALNPFIMVSLYDMTGPTFPPHPHAGFSVATYILPESPIGFINQDTIGNRNRIAPGALHVTVAGRGVQHEEQPEASGSLARGFQIWIDHSPADREIVPHALHLKADDVPRLERDGALIRVVLGTSNGLVSPLALPTAVRIIDVALEMRGRFTQELVKGENAVVLVMGGAVEIGGRRVAAGSGAISSLDGDQLVISAPEGPARFTLFAGHPLHGPRIQRGPFVASTADQMMRFMTRFQSGEFGELIPFAHNPGWSPREAEGSGA